MLARPDLIAFAKLGGVPCPTKVQLIFPFGVCLQQTVHKLLIPCEQQMDKNNVLHRVLLADRFSPIKLITRLRIFSLRYVLCKPVYHLYFCVQLHTCWKEQQNDRAKIQEGNVKILVSLLISAFGSHLPQKSELTSVRGIEKCSSEKSGERTYQLVCLPFISRAQTRKTVRYTA